MPYLPFSSYRAPLLLRNPHANTVYAALFREVPEIAYERERIDTPDGDFLDLDWALNGSDSLVIGLHGLEGHTDRPYIRGLLRYFQQRGWDGMGFHFRGCSGELNRKLHSYHMGHIDDLEYVVHYALDQRHYRRVVLVGYSLGGNVVINYLGRKVSDLPPELIAGVAFSVPTDLAAANERIHQWYNRAYLKRFLNTMNPKMEEKLRAFPEAKEWLGDFKTAKSFFEYDAWYTAPIHGFRDARDYWESSSSVLALPQVRRPLLLLNAWDDTFLSANCFPKELAEVNPHFYLETPAHGGHIGFVEFRKDGAYYTERRAFEFVERMLANSQ
jgi:predicted alpha/beta-fold hydrolase